MTTKIYVSFENEPWNVAHEVKLDHIPKVGDKIIYRCNFWESYIVEDVSHHIGNETNCIFIKVKTDKVCAVPLQKSRGPKSQFTLNFTLWSKEFFKQHAPIENGWLPVSIVKEAAIEGNVVSVRWWNEKSSEFLKKENVNGEWRCRLKGLEKI